MRFMIIVKATRDSEAGVMPEEKLIAEMAEYHEELAKAGVLLDASGLQSSSKGWRIRYTGAKRTFVDGPFPETKEQLGGILILEARDLNHAIQLMSKHPGVKAGPFEIRPAEDLSALVAESERRRHPGRAESRGD
jgi:hypothetical protein